jgi:hypothetical protein
VVAAEEGGLGIQDTSRMHDVVDVSDQLGMDVRSSRMIADALRRQAWPIRRGSHKVHLKEADSRHVLPAHDGLSRRSGSIYEMAKTATNSRRAQLFARPLGPDATAEIASWTAAPLCRHGNKAEAACRKVVRRYMNGITDRL